MDVSVPFSKKSANIGDNVDRNSKLSDEVLSHILSFLSTSQAVSTSILSKRWECVWTLTPNLDFSDQFSHKVAPNYSNHAAVFSSFKEYVDHVLFYHGGVVIKKCIFKCFTKDAAPNIYAWVCAVITCNVEELTVETSFFTAQPLPWRVFTCRTLVALRISGMFVLDLPTNICFPCLKTLSLAGVVYAGDLLMHKLFSGCPILEDLALVRHEWDGVQVMNVCIPSLKRLSLSSKLHYLAGCRYKTQINIPFLEYLEVCDGSRIDYSLSASSSLTEAHIYGSCLPGLLIGISQSLNAVVRDSTLPTFHNLTILVLYVGEFIDWNLLPDLLESSPNLEILVFPKGLVVPKENGWDFCRFYWHDPEEDPECLLSSLKIIEINNFVGMPGEIYLVEYFLEFTEVLERVIIRGYDFSGRPRMRKKLEAIRNEIMGFPRGCSDCKLVFTM